MKYIKAFSEFLFPHIPLKIFLIILIIINTSLSMVSPYALKLVIDDCIPNKDFSLLYKIGIILFLLYILRGCSNYLYEYFSTIISNRIGDSIKNKLFYNLMHQPVHYFENNNQGNIIQQVNMEVNRVQGFLTNGVIGFLNNIFLVIGLSGMLYFTNKTLFIIYLLVFPIPILINFIFNKSIKKLIKESTFLEGAIFNFYVDRIKNMMLIKSYNSYISESQNLSIWLKSIYSNQIKRTKYSSLSSNTSFFFISMGPLLILIFGGYQAILGSISIGSVVAFIQYSNRLTPHLNGIFNLHIQFSQILVSMKHIYPLLNPVNINKENSMSIWPNFINEECFNIEFKNMCFSRNENLILKSLSLSLVSGKSYGIVGESGSGKSTLLKILCGFYMPESGELTVNNKYSFFDLDTNSWLNNISIVFQDPMILNDSILKNISYGAVQPDEKKIWKVLEEVGLFKFVNNLPLGLGSILGDNEGELKLSGGQKQQIALSRALFKDRHILILDEATSAIDTKNEEIILKNIKARYKERIVILVSHRLSTIKNVDEISVITNGTITERGSHLDLVSNKKQYYTIFKSQI